MDSDVPTETKNARLDLIEKAAASYDFVRGRDFGLAKADWINRLLGKERMDRLTPDEKELWGR